MDGGDENTSLIGGVEGTGRGAVRIRGKKSKGGGGIVERKTYEYTL
jgi:hypothetical protein